MSIWICTPQLTLFEFHNKKYLRMAYVLRLQLADYELSNNYIHYYIV